MSQERPKPKTISIAPRWCAAGEELAAQDHRDFSNEVEWLIESEFLRRQNGIKLANGAAPVSAPPTPAEVEEQV